MKRLYFDIETQANPEALESAPEPKAAGNLKDPEKIVADIASKKAELIERAALDPDYGKILSIGWATDPDTKDMTVLVTGEKDSMEVEMTESMVIDSFWSALDNCQGACVGFNIISFDLPYIMRRSMALGIKPPLVPFMARFRTEPITDLYPIMYGWQPGKGLKAIAKLYGLIVLAPDVDGSMVHTLTTEELVKYQVSDVFLTQQLYNRMNGIYFRHVDTLASHAAHLAKIAEEEKKQLELELPF